MMFRVWRASDSGTVHRIPDAGEPTGWREVFRRDMPPARAIVRAACLDEALAKARRLYGRAVEVVG